MITFPLIGGLLVAVIIYFIMKSWFKAKPKVDGIIPPGPRALPIIGNLHKISMGNFVPTLQKWADEYGPVYKMEFGPRTAYVFSDYKLVKELFSSDPAFVGRMNMRDATDIYNDLDGDKAHGIISTEGEHWEQLRRFTLRQLRDFGFGKQTMEPIIMEEVNEIMEFLKANEGKPLTEFRGRLSISGINSLWRIVTGKRFKHTDPFIQNLTQSVRSTMEKLAQGGGMFLALPWLKKIAPELCGYAPLRRAFDGIRGVLTDAVDEHKASYSGDFERDFIDAFLKEIKECKDPESAFYKDFGERQLIGTVFDMFMAGGETTATTLGWIILYLAYHPEVQKKLQDELDTVVGKSRTCYLSDRPNLPYVEAVIAESLRFSTMIPQGAGQRCMADRTFHGYAVPKGTVLISWIYGIHYSEKVWGDPKNFRPERFINKDGKFQKHEALMAFSVGRRQCAGETLARDSIFLYLTSIFHQFQVRFHSDPGSNPGLEPRLGMTRLPKDYKVVFSERN